MAGPLHNNRLAMAAAKAWRDTTEPEVTRRAFMVPLGEYSDGTVNWAWPSILADGVQGWNSLADSAARARANPGLMFDEDFIGRAAADSFNAAGLAATGGFASGAATVPTNTLGMFAGRLAKTADHAALARAEQMASQGIPREQIWSETGWFQGVDGKWRFEIDDSKATLGHGSTYGQAMSHPELFSAYPDLGRAEFQFSRGSGGNYNPGGYNRFEERTTTPMITVGAAQTNSTPLSVGLHEGQHGVQYLEGMAAGGNRGMFTSGDIAAERARIASLPEDATGWTNVGTAAGDMPDADLSMRLYRRLAGETEARAVQQRQNLTADERRARPPWLDYDVPESNQIVRFGSNGPQMSVPDGALASNAMRARPGPGPLIPKAEAMGADVAPQGLSIGLLPTLYANPRTAPLVPAAIDAMEANTLAGGALRRGETANAQPGNLLRGQPDYSSMLRDLGGDWGNAVVIQNGNIVHGSLQGWNGKGSRLAVTIKPDGTVSKGLIAYHGSPHDFDRFDLSKIGSGEGAQAYGHGLYFAENEAVAKYYKNALANKTLTTSDEVLALLSDTFADKNEVIQALKGELGQSSRFGGKGVYTRWPEAGGSWFAKNKTKAAVEDALRRLEGGEELRPADQYQAGRMYQVNINADPDSFLDWDLPLSQQSEAVRALLQHPAVKQQADFFGDPSGEKLTGKSAYGAVAKWNTAGNQRAGSGDPTPLREAGIPGVRYLDQGSRTAGATAGSRNYVVFDDSLVDILRKYSNPPTAAAVPAGMAASDDDMSNDPFLNYILRQYGGQ